MNVMHNLCQAAGCRNRARHAVANYCLGHAKWRNLKHMGRHKKAEKGGSRGRPAITNPDSLYELTRRAA